MHAGGGFEMDLNFNSGAAASLQQLSLAHSLPPTPGHTAPLYALSSSIYTQQQQQHQQQQPQLSSCAPCALSVAAMSAPVENGDLSGSGGAAGVAQFAATSSRSSASQQQQFGNAAYAIASQSQSFSGSLFSSTSPALQAQQLAQMHQVARYISDRVSARRQSVGRAVREVVAVVQDLLKLVEAAEPRFVSTLVESTCVGSPGGSGPGGSGPAGGVRYEGLRVLSSTEFLVCLYLNQMGVFNFADDSSLPGCAVLKLSDGRKRSMSLWVEFITASGYLSARKIRARFASLVAQAAEKSAFRDVLRVIPGPNSESCSEVRVRVRERYTVLLVPGFRVSGVWPRGALGAQYHGHHPPQWPGPHAIAELRAEGFALLATDTVYMREKQSHAEGDAWAIAFPDAERRLLRGAGRARCLALLKTLRDRNLVADSPNSSQSAGGGVAEEPVVSAEVLTALLLYECEKHPLEAEWDECCVADRATGVLLQLIACLLARRCPQYLVPGVDLFRGLPGAALDAAARRAWRVVRELITSPNWADRL